MSLSREEQEIHISKMADQDYFSIYTTDPIYMRKIEKIGIKPYKVDKESETGEIVAWYYRIPKKQITFKRERELTEEQRADLKLRAENMRKQRNKSE